MEDLSKIVFLNEDEVRKLIPKLILKNYEIFRKVGLGTLWISIWKNDPPIIDNIYGNIVVLETDDSESSYSSQLTNEEIEIIRNDFYFLRFKGPIEGRIEISISVPIPNFHEVINAKAQSEPNIHE